MTDQEMYRRRRKDNYEPFDQDFTPGQFSKPENRIPWFAIAYACFLFITGALLCYLSGCIYFERLDPQTYGDRLWPLFILGVLMFIPGAYHVHIAVRAFFGSPGFRFCDIADFDY